MEVTEYLGGCHCGQVRFKLTTPKITNVIRCNCSICKKSGYLHVHVAKNDLDIFKGTEHLVSYKFNTRQATHLFCQTCGVKAFYIPRSHPHGYSVNLNCIENFVGDVHIDEFNGSQWEAEIEQLPAQPIDQVTT